MRHDPFANAAAVLRLQHGDRLPRIYTTKWYRKNASGKFVWPGYSKNMRMFNWMIDRIEGQAKGTETMFDMALEYNELN